MKSLTDNIIDSLTEKMKGYIGSLKNEKTVAHSQGFIDGLVCAIDTIKTAERQADFNEVAMIMIKHLGDPEKYYPHNTVIATSTHAELLSGVQYIGNAPEYIEEK